MAGLSPLLRDIEVMVSDLKSPKAKSARLAVFAREQIDEAKRINGQSSEPEIAVDGKAGAALEAVKPNGIIVANFDLFTSMLEWIGAELVRASPVLTGKYARSHVLEVDGNEVSVPGPIPAGERYVFVNRQPYAAKIEPQRVSRRYRGRWVQDRDKRRTGMSTSAGQSSQAPDGVYQAVAAVAANRFGNVAKISFTFSYFDRATNVSHPAIVVKPH